MTGQFRRLKWLGPAGLLVCCGCQFGKPAPYEADPLFGSREPAPGAGVVSVPLEQPLYPSPPPRPVAPASAALPPGERPSEPLPPPMPLPSPDVLPDLASPDAGGPDGIPVSTPADAPPKTVTGRFGHDPEYHWLQGVVDRHYRGHVSLRYRPATEDDRWGGKVHLLGDVPDECLDGDVIFVEGELCPDEAPKGLDGAAMYPGYRVDRVWKVRPDS